MTIDWFSIYWGVAAMLLPFYVRWNSFNDIRICRNVAFFALVVVSYLVFGTGNEKVAIRIRIPLFFLAVLSFFNHKNLYSGAAIEQTLIFGISLMALCQLMTFCLNFEIISLFLKISAIIQSILLILNDYGINPYNLNHHIELPLGSLGQQTLSGAHISILFPLFLSSYWVLFIPLLLYAVFLTKSAMTVAALVAGIVVFVNFKHLRSYKFWLGSLLSGVVLFFSTRGLPFFSDNMRYGVWRGLFSKFIHWEPSNILFGSGLGWLFDHSDFSNAGQIFTYAHNEALESLWAFGILGTGLIMYLISQISYCKSRYAISLFGAALANSIGNFNLHISAIALPVLITYAYLVTKNKGDTYGNYSY